MIENSAPPQLQEQFLSFVLPSDHQALLPTHQLLEILSVTSGQIIPIADMPRAVMGVFNWRGEILWMVDLGELLGFPPLFSQSLRRPHFSTLILQSQGKTLGLVVEQVAQMVWCNPAQIQATPAPRVTPELAAYLRGYYLQAETTWLVLDGAAIIAAFNSDDSELRAIPG